jgi:hypothetical protein
MLIARIIAMLFAPVLLAVLMTGPVLADSRTAEQQFVDEYKCELVVRLEQIRSSRLPGRPLRKNRYIILTPSADQDRFVQCIFVEGDRRLLCEAASGFYAEKRGRARSSVAGPTAITALRELGFDTEAQAGNFQQMFEIKTKYSLSVAARQVLLALHRGYGAQPSDNLDFKAPLGPGGGSVKARCMPNS